MSNQLAKDASELCLKASELLAERGNQYDGSGKETKHGKHCSSI